MNLVLVDVDHVLTYCREHLGPGGDDIVRDAIDSIGHVIESTEPEWCVFYGGPDPENAAGVQRAYEEAAAREDAHWFIESGVATRLVAHGPWIVQEPEP